MVAKTLQQALIGDPDPARFEWLKNLLDAGYGLEAVQAKTFEELLNLVEARNRARELSEKSRPEGQEPEEDRLLIFIADDLTPTLRTVANAAVVKGYFTTLGYFDKWGDFVIIHIQTRNTPLDTRGITPPRLTLHVPDPLTPEAAQGANRELDRLGFLKRVSGAESKLVWDRNCLPLREQIRALSERRNVSHGEEHLARLISRCIDCSGVQKIEVEQLGQGRSGASIFRLRIEAAAASGAKGRRPEFVLKICPAGDVWKLKSEIRGHVQAGLGLGLPGYRVHLPALNRAHVPAGGLDGLGKDVGPNMYIVRSGQWYAVHYDFLGGEQFGEFIDLETALTASADELEKRTAGTDFAVEAANANKVRAARAQILDTILSWLYENWYANPRSEYLRREERVMWDVNDADGGKYIDKPPYQLTGRAKYWIQSFLNSPEAKMGGRFFRDWESHRARVFRFLSEDRPAAVQLGRLGEPTRALLSQAHGDLNSNNVLLWLKNKQPFMIDMPFYQEAGHALQDFALLEVEIKFALLDRQKDSPPKRLKAFEHTHTQTTVWQEMEDRLLKRWDQKASRWPAQGYSGNVQLCFELVQLIRRRASKVQQIRLPSGPDPGDFLAEYWPPLLYHTLRAIGHPSLSIFKRLLAVYSAGSILAELNCYTDTDGV